MGNKASQMLSYYHTQREVVKMQMDSGGCGTKFADARSLCEKWRRGKGTTADVWRCREATAALRRCMASKEAHFRTCIAALDKGLEEDENWRKREWFEEKPPAEERWKWRWWTGMLKP
ncbi:unnamed protein product [Alopecurus aequalis]